MQMTDGSHIEGVNMLGQRLDLIWSTEGRIEEGGVVTCEVTLINRTTSEERTQTVVSNRQRVGDSAVRARMMNISPFDITPWTLLAK